MNAYGLSSYISSLHEVEIVYSVHLNPNVRRIVFPMLGDRGRIHQIDPLSYGESVQLMNKSNLILTDSGGIQEEAPSLGKPVLVMREATERPEAIEAGTARLVGTRRESITASTIELLENEEAYQAMTHAKNPFGDGGASQRIVTEILQRWQRLQDYQR